MPDLGKTNKLDSNNNWQENAAQNITQHKHYEHFKNRAQGHRSSPKKNSGHHGHQIPHQIPLGLTHNKAPQNNLPRKANSTPNNQHISPTPAGAGAHLPGGGGGGTPAAAAAAPAENEKKTSSKPSLNIEDDYTIRNRWVCQKKLGSGGFGEVWRAFDKNIRKNVAVKMEALTQSKQVLKMEVAVLKKLQSQSKHVCKLIDCGRNQMCNYMIMTLLGHSLADLRRGQTSNAFTVSTALRITRQMLFAIRDLHNVGYLHRDIKPSNFAIGLNNPRKIYMFDFGLARVYMVDGKVREARSVAGFRGTVRYASLTAHKSKEMGRGDDLWSLFYIMLEFVGLNLPWKRIKARDDVGKMKDEQNHRDLLDQCEQDFNFPAKHFYKFLDHISALEYATQPDYDLCDGLFQQACQDMGYSLDDPYDWEKTTHSSSSQQESSRTRNAAPAAADTNERRRDRDRDDYHNRDGYTRDRNSHGYHRSPSKGPSRHKASSKPRDSNKYHSSGRHAREVSAPPVVQSSRERDHGKERVRKTGKPDKNDNNNNNVYRGRASESRDPHPQPHNVAASLNLNNMIRGGSAAPEAGRFNKPTAASPHHMLLVNPNKITDNIFGEAVAETREDLSGKTLSDLSLNKGQDDANRNENNSGSNNSGDRRARQREEAANLYKSQQKHLANYRSNRYPHNTPTQAHPHHQRAKQRKSLPANYVANQHSAGARASPVSSKPNQSSSSLNNAPSPPPGDRGGSAQPQHPPHTSSATAQSIPKPVTTTLPATIDLGGYGGQPHGTKPVVLSTSPLATAGQSFHPIQSIDPNQGPQPPLGFYPPAAQIQGLGEPLLLAEPVTPSPIVTKAAHLPSLQPQHSHAEPTTAARHSQLTHHPSSASTYTLIAATSNLNLGKADYPGQSPPTTHLSPQANHANPSHRPQSPSHPLPTGKVIVQDDYVDRIAQAESPAIQSPAPQAMSQPRRPSLSPYEELPQITALSPMQPQPSASLTTEPQHTIETASAGNVSNIRRNFEKWGAQSQKRKSLTRKLTGQLPGARGSGSENSPPQPAVPSPLNHPASSFVYQTLPKSQSSSCINDLPGAMPIGGERLGSGLPERSSTIYTAQQLLHEGAQSNGNTPPTSGEHSANHLQAPTTKVHPPVPLAGPRNSISGPTYVGDLKAASFTAPQALGASNSNTQFMYSSNTNNQSIENTITTNNTTGNTHSGNKLKPTPPRTQRQNSGISGRIRRFNQLAEKGGANSNNNNNNNNYTTQTSPTTAENIKS